MVFVCLPFCPSPTPPLRLQRPGARGALGAAPGAVAQRGRALRQGVGPGGRANASHRGRSDRSGGGRGGSDRFRGADRSGGVMEIGWIEGDRRLHFSILEFFLMRNSW